MDKRRTQNYNLIMEVLILIIVLLGAVYYIRLRRKGPKPKTYFGMTKPLIIFIIALPIFGIVSGIVLFNFGETTKSYAVETKYNEIVQYTKDEIKKCKSGEINYMNGLQNCHPTAEKTIEGLFEVYKDMPNPFTFNENNLPDIGPKILRDSGSNISDRDLGFINLSSSGENIIFSVCFEKPCSKEENRKTNTVSF